MSTNFNITNENFEQLKERIEFLRMAENKDLVELEIIFGMKKMINKESGKVFYKKTWNSLDKFCKIHNNFKDKGKISESEMLDHFKENAVSVYHPCGTCKMDEDKSKGVVSEKMKVHDCEIAHTLNDKY